MIACGYKMRLQAVCLSGNWYLFIDEGFLYRFLFMLTIFLKFSSFSFLFVVTFTFFYMEVSLFFYRSFFQVLFSCFFLLCNVSISEMNLYEGLSLGKFSSTVMIVSFRTDRPGQTVQTQIRLLLEEQSDQGLHCLPFRLHRLDSLLYGKAT